MSKIRYFIHDEGIYNFEFDGERFEVYGFLIKELVKKALVK